eukprot:m.92453 g.92453  ORF g.92453 m.92453 type:complete len:345 (+) comp15333_c0_seq1:161-1195(+)
MLFGILRASRASKEAGHANIQALVGDFSAGRLLLWSRETVDEPSGHELLAGNQGRLFLAVQKNDWLLGCPVDPLRRQIRLFVPPGEGKVLCHVLPSDGRLHLHKPVDGAVGGQQQSVVEDSLDDALHSQHVVVAVGRGAQSEAVDVARPSDCVGPAGAWPPRGVELLELMLQAGLQRGPVWMNTKHNLPRLTELGHPILRHGMAVRQDGGESGGTAVEHVIDAEVARSSLGRADQLADMAICRQAFLQGRGVAGLQLVVQLEVDANSAYRFALAGELSPRCRDLLQLLVRQLPAKGHEGGRDSELLEAAWEMGREVVTEGKGLLPVCLFKGGGVLSDQPAEVVL